MTIIRVGDEVKVTYFGRPVGVVGKPNTFIWVVRKITNKYVTVEDYKGSTMKVNVGECSVQGVIPA